MIKGITDKSKLKIHWKVNPYNYSLDKANSIIQKFSKKYGCPKDNIKLLPEFIVLNDKGETVSMTDNVVKNIQDPVFQQQLFIDYLRLHQIENYDFEIIKGIDNEINAKIDYEVYDKYRNYSIKWIKWSNFLSYGRDNFFDFSSLNEIVLLSGEPANQSGKTTFAIDLLHFLLFGKTSKAATQDKIFNKFLDEETEVVVEGCLSIEGSDYVIKRRLTRPSLAKRTSKSKTTQKVEYYKVVGESLEELVDYVDSFEGESTAQTNKIIKESIGKEEDFDMVMCATSSNLDDLIEKKETERGKLLSRWIGLLPLEQKDVLSREKYNGEIKPYLLSNRYNTETLTNEIKEAELYIRSLEQDLSKNENEIITLEKDIKSLEDAQQSLYASKIQIDETLLKIDKTTLLNAIEKIKNDGIRKKQECDALNKQLEGFKDVQFEVVQFDEATQVLAKLDKELAIMREQKKSITKDIEALQKSEYCPLCGRKYDNVDNSSKINEFQSKLDELAKSIETKHIDYLNKSNVLESLKDLRRRHDEKSKLTLQINALQFDIVTLRERYKDLILKKQEYGKNTEAIDKNNQIDMQLRNLDVDIRNKRNTKETTIRFCESLKSNIQAANQKISDNTVLITKLAEEEVLVKHWKLYLEMVGKNGISKMVLRKTLPIINAQMNHLLSDVCDFDVEVTINDKSEIHFFLVKDGVYSDLSSGSGFEKTAASLVLRVVLGNISSLPKLDGIILDELWGRVAKENLDNMHKVLEKILVNYKYIIQISHLDEVKDWSQQHIVVKKKDNISYLEMR